MKTFFKSVFSSLRFQKAYSLLNIAGLSAGLTCFALIALWVKDELSFDKFNKNYNRIYRLVSVEKRESQKFESAMSGAPMAKALQNDYPEVENAVRLKKREEIVNRQNQPFLQDGILLTDPSFFKIFSYRLSKGNPSTALNQPFSLVLTESTAKKYFGDTDPIGQSLLLNMYDSTGYGAYYTVTGLMPDPPKNAHFTFNMLASFNTIEAIHPEILTVDGWGDGSYYTYLLLKKGINGSTFSNRIAHFYKKYVGDLFKTWEPVYSYRLQPISEIHLQSNLQNEIALNGNLSQVYIFFTIGIFILILAGINYTNLATARSSCRAKEVGIKKMAGAGKKRLALQFISESVCMSLLALLLAFFFSHLLQPYFYVVTGKSLNLFSSPALALFLLIVAILLGILSGTYPAWVLTAFKPVSVLKGSFKSGDKGIFLRKTLVITQFTITMILVSGIVIIYTQMTYINHKDLGYDHKALLYLKVNGNSDVIKGFKAFKNDLESNRMISGLSTSNSLIVGGLGTGGAETVDRLGNPLSVNTSRLRVDPSFLAVYGIQLLAGTNFSEHSQKDSIRPILLNQAAVRKFGWENNDAAIGKPFSMGNTEGRIIGVTNDFHFSSLEENIHPLAIYPLENHFSRITLNANMSDPKSLVNFVQKKWEQHFPGALFDFNFMDDQINQQYLSEKRFSTLFLFFSILSLLIACMGLYGLISFTVFQRTKEIGIRKVLGATTGSVATLLTRNLLRLVLISGLISIPVSWYAMNRWLRSFAYRVDLSWWMFGIAGMLVLLIAMLTISFQAIKAAIANPVKSLRTE